jgi:hypothetical protein
MTGNFTQLPNQFLRSQLGEPLTDLQHRLIGVLASYEDSRITPTLTMLAVDVGRGECEPSAVRRAMADLVERELVERTRPGRVYVYSVRTFMETAARQEAPTPPIETRQEAPTPPIRPRKEAPTPPTEHVVQHVNPNTGHGREKKPNLKLEMRAFACEDCGAPPGVACRGLGGLNHDARFDAYRVFQQLEEQRESEREFARHQAKLDREHRQREAREEAERAAAGPPATPEQIEELKRAAGFS